MQNNLNAVNLTHNICMEQKVFFSFYYDKELWRANFVKNSWEKKPERVANGFLDYFEFEKIKKCGEASIKGWIDKQLEGTTVTVVLIGPEAFNRQYCKYAIERSYERGNGMLGVYIHKLKDKCGNISPKGSNKFGVIGKNKNNDSVFFSMAFPTYDWIDDNGCYKLKEWIEEAAQKCETRLSVSRIM